MGATININHRKLLEHPEHTARNRVFDLLAGSILFVFILPSLILAVLATLLCHRRPIFKQISRARKDGRVVTILNFRLEQPPVGATRTVGRYNRFLVRSRLVALPEIINIMTGELSLFDPDGARPSLFAA